MKEHPRNPPLVSVPSDPAQLWQELVDATRDKPWLQRLLGEHGAALYLRFRAAYQRLLRLRAGQLRGLQRKLGMGLAGAALLLALSSSSGLAASSATAPTADITVDGTICTLAVAIDNANSGGDTDGEGGCDTGSAGADTLTLINDINLTSALPEIASEITIEGGNHTIAGNNTFRILHVINGASLTLNQATISGGSADKGGGIYNKGALTVQNSTISGSSASSGGGINNRGTLSVTDSTLSGNSANFYSGGAIFNQSGNVMIQNTTLSGNSAIYGGGIDNSGWLTLQNSTLTSNVGGGIANWGTVTVQNSTISGNSINYYGGGIFSSSGAVTVLNSTISGNSASYGGGIYNRGTLMTVQNSTISSNSASNGGGIYNKSTVTVQNSIVVNQVAGTDCDNTDTLNSNGHNIESGTSCGFTSAGDQQNTDPLLGPLADNGGPTWTHTLLPGSTAIDVASTASCSGKDQRGVPRNQDGNGIASSDECDIGAVEAIALSASLINDGADVEFTWAGAELDGYQLWRSEIHYDSYALFQDNLTGPSFSTPVDTTTNYYYELRGLVSGETVHISRRIGVFSFALVPGSS